MQMHSQAIILLYHRVAELPSDPQLLCVTPQHFSEHLEHLRRHYRIMSLSELVRALKERRLPKHAVVITFDDGYADNLLNAKPLLEHYEAPATAFIVTGYVGSEHEFWWDELERLVLLNPELPKHLQVKVNGKIYEWHLNKWARLSEKEISEHRMWNVLLPDDPTPRHRAYRELHRLLRPLGEEEREAVLAQLRAQSEDEGSGRTDYRAMTPEEVCRLADGGLVEVGAHTETHPVLATQPVETQQKEITESKRHLEVIIGRRVTAFSYPYGGRSDVGQDAVRLVREAGYDLACANFPSPITRRSNAFFLPRYLVRDWDGEEFARRLRGFFHGSP
jgi:peptidoglycan/xylan/chitin deacetylase (PgdA/CDA1 family)